MDSNSHQVRRDQWLRIVTECNSCEQTLSKRQWCQMNGVNTKSFYYWQRQFRNELLLQSAASAAPVAAPAFVDITSCVSRSTATTSEEVLTKEGALVPELMIQSGDFRIYVSGAIREQTLDTVMKVLRHA